MRILLVAYMRSLIGIDRLMKIPSLGLSSIAAHLDRQICDVRIADLLVASADSRGYFQQLLMEYKPDVMGFSVITMQYFEALELARITKDFNKDIKVVMGGYHPTLDYEMILEKDVENVVDFVIRGEAEIAFNELVKSLNNGGDLSEVPNLSYRDNGSVRHNPVHGLLDLDEIKLPDRDVRINRKGYHIFGYKADIVEMSRGCPFSCKFCSSPSMYDRGYRKFRIERILEDIRDTQRRGARAIFVTDHNVSGDPEWYAEVCKAITEAKLNNIKYAVQADVRGIKQVPQLAEIMVKSGVAWVLLGIESVSRENLGFMQKEQFTNSDVFEVVNGLKRHGAIVVGTFILGSPDDTEKTIRATYDYAKKLKIDVASFLTLTPYPNTPARDELIRQDLITNLYDYSKYDLWHANVRTKHLSSQQVSELLEECDAKYILDSGAIWRLIRKHPVYIARLLLQELIKTPKRILPHLKGMLPYLKSAD